MSRRISVRPGKPASFLGVVVGVILVGLGVIMAIPRFGIFGVFWTLVAG